VEGFQHQGVGATPAQPVRQAVPVLPVPPPEPPLLAVALVSGPGVVAEAAAAAIGEHTGAPAVRVHRTAQELIDTGTAAGLQIVLIEAGPGAAEALADLARALPPHVPRRVLLARELDAELVGLALEHRVDGVVLAAYGGADVVAALRHIAGGHAVFPDGWQELMATHVPRASAIPELSERQRQVLDLLASGRRNDEIADELLLSPNTVKFHVRAIFSRLGVRNRAEASELLARLEREQ
jgi:NarL family two-component system response regulator LiaR